MIKISVYEFPPVINIATIQDIECQTGNRFRESPEYWVGTIDVNKPGPEEQDSIPTKNKGGGSVCM